MLGKLNDDSELLHHFNDRSSFNIVQHGGRVNAMEMSDVLLDGIPPLFSAARDGDSHAAMVAMRRLLVRLRELNPQLAQQLKDRLPGGHSANLPRVNSTKALGVEADGRAIRAPQDPETQAGLLKRIDTTYVQKPVMGSDDASVIESFVVEHSKAATLQAAGLSPRTTVFLVGPPGVGKTMTAAWLAHRLGVPLHQVEISSLISSYLGRTGQNLRDVFDFARAGRRVILLDEFDAIAKRRDDQGDLGEMRRIVSVLLKEIEEWPGPSILVAATNHPELVDPAVFRRFQLVIKVALPGKDEIVQMLRLHLAALSPSDSVLSLASVLLLGSSGSDVRNVAHESRRAAALDPALTASEALLLQLGGRARTPAARKQFAREARKTMKRASFVDLARWLGVSKGSIHNYLKENER